MKASAARARYAAPAKVAARDLVVAFAQELGVESVLDLWGGGASARAFRDALPNAAVVSCEADQELYPALRLDAQAHGYAHHFGDFRKAEGKFDFVWLDLCSQWSGGARDAVIAAAKKLNKDGTLALTIMAARENPEIAADRLFLVPKSIERASGLRIVMFYPYQTVSPMWLILLRGDVHKSWWSDLPERVVRIKGKNIDNWQWQFGWGADGNGTPFDIVVEALEDEGYWFSPWRVDAPLSRLWDMVENAAGLERAA